MIVAIMITSATAQAAHSIARVSFFKSFSMLPAPQVFIDVAAKGAHSKFTV